MTAWCYQGWVGFFVAGFTLLLNGQTNFLDSVKMLMLYF
jgi:hypothetical protein